MRTVRSMSDLINRQGAIKQFCNQCKGQNEPCEHSQSCKTMKVLEALPSAEPKTDGVFVKGGLTISGDPPMPDGCMDCKLQDRCLCIPPDLSADEISELYISRRPNCPLSMVAKPKTGECRTCKRNADSGSETHEDKQKK